MDYQALRFMGFYIHDDNAQERIKTIIANEMEARGPQKNGSNLGQPDQGFKDSVMKFRDDYQKFGEALLKRARSGEDIERIEIKTLDRAERFYASALGTTAEKTPLRISFLDAGKAMHGKGHGLSLTRQVEIAAGLADSPHSRGGASVEVSHHRSF